MILGSLKKYLLIAGAAVMGVLVIALRIVSAGKDAAEAKATEFKVKAKGEAAARKHVTDTVEKTRDVEDDIRRDSAAGRRERLREYSSGTRPDDQ